MKLPNWPSLNVEGEIAALMQTLQETAHRLEELTHGEIDTISDRDGRTLVLRHAQEQLRHREAATQAGILNALPAHVALLDARGAIVVVNDTWRHFATENAMADVSQGVGSNYLEVCDQATGPGATEAFEACAGIRSVLSGEASTFSIEYACHSPTDQRWFLMIASSLSDKSDGGAIVTHTDITERKIAESSFLALSDRTKQREHLLTRMLSSISDFTYIFDREGRFLFVNEPLLRLWGVPLEQAIGKNFFDLGYPADLASRLQSQIQHVLETRDSVTDETRFVSASGVAGYFEYILAPVVASDGTVDFVVGSTRDISERKRAELEVSASDEKFRLLADNIEDVFWIRSHDMLEVLYVSPAYERMWGRSVQSLYDEPEAWADSIVPEDRERVLSACDLLTGDTASMDLEYRIERPDGQIRWLRGRGLQVREGGKLVRNIGIMTDITDKQRAAEELRTSEAEFRTLAEAMPQIVWITRPDGANIYFNLQWTAYTGMTLEESHGDGWNRPFHPDDQQPAREAWQKATTEGGTYSVESRLRRADGIYRWWLVRGVPLKDATGAIVKWFGTCTDIHDLKVAELEISRSNRELALAGEALQASVLEQRQLAELLEVERSRLLAAQRVAKVGSWETDLVTLTVQWSEETARIFESTRTGITQKEFLRMVHPDDRVAVGAAFTASIRQTEACCFQHRLLLPDGKIRHVEERWQIVFDDQRLPVRAIGTCQDITDRRLSEIALEANQARLRKIFDGLGPSVFVALLTPEGIVVEINRSPLEAAGLQAEDVIGRHFADTHWWAYSPEVQRQLRNAIERAARGEASRYDVRISGSNGAFIDIDFSLQPALDQSGKVVFLIPSASVITERKQAEAALRQSQKLEAVGQLAAGVAHEFNNILQTLLSMTTMTRSCAGTPEVVRIAGEMDVQIQRGASVTRQLLLSSRHAPGTKASFDLSEQVAIARDLLGRLIPENIQLIADIEPEHSWVVGDVGQIHQVLLNLVINARDAMPDGGTITIRVRSTDTEAVVEVEDDGQGFDEKTREHLFEPFFTTKEPGQGTGLGLAVVHGIVAQHRGRLEAESKAGAGALFRIILPTSLPAAVEAIERTSQPEIAGSGTILLVEDEVAVREGISMWLTMIGYEVIAVSRAEEALTLPLAPAPDLLLSDVSLPGMAGHTLAERLCVQWPGMKVALMTGYADAKTSSLSHQRGWKILEKPFEMDALREHLSTMLAPGSFRAPSPSAA